MSRRLQQHREEKKSRSNFSEAKPKSDSTAQAATDEKEKKPTQVKRLRLRGDWSDTGGKRLISSFLIGFSVRSEFSTFE